MTNHPLVPTFEDILNGNLQPLCNARDLHGFLEVGKVYAAWIQERIEKYDFKEHIDYTLTISKTGKRLNVMQKDYFLSLSMAKELAMVENNEKGRQVRQYFISIEQELIYEGRRAFFLACQLQKVVLDMKPEWKKIIRYHSLGLDVYEIAKLLEVSPRYARKTMRDMQNCGFDFNKNESNCQPQQLPLLGETVR